MKGDPIYIPVLCWDWKKINEIPPLLVFLRAVITGEYETIIQGILSVPTHRGRDFDFSLLREH